MIIYAVFICMSLSQTCKPAEQRTYASRGQCESSIGQMTAVKSDNGRFYYDLPSRDFWFECLSKHVDTWESQR
jgi:hypothetical protein